MYTHLRSLKEYEDRYDRITVKQGRRDMEWFWRAHDEFIKKINTEYGKDPKPKATEFWWERLCFWLVELPLGERWAKRDDTIRKWQLADESKDQRLENARPQNEPYCYHCGKTGLRLSTKILHSRTGDYSNPKDEQVLFMFKCQHCQKPTSYWEDGELFKTMPHLCSKCQSPMTDKDVKRDKIITTTYTCPVCGHTESHKLDLRPKKDKPDPDYERDKAMFCFDDERGKKYLEYKVSWDWLHEQFKKSKEKESNKDLYEAVSKLEKLKVAELIEKLQPVIEKAGYIEVRFDKPEVSRDFTIGFSCLDSQSARDDYTSSSNLRKVIKNSLEQSNWRLMTEGISYRLGYLSGRLRAFEGDEDLLNLIAKNKRFKNK